MPQPRKHGGPRKADSDLNMCYPELEEASVDDVTEKNTADAVEKVLEREQPRKDVLLPLMTCLCLSWRGYILHEAVSVSFKDTIHCRYLIVSVQYFSIETKTKNHIDFMCVWNNWTLMDLNLVLISLFYQNCWINGLLQFWSAVSTQKGGISRLCFTLLMMKVCWFLSIDIYSMPFVSSLQHGYFKNIHVLKRHR